MKGGVKLVACGALIGALAVAQTSSYKYVRIGSDQDTATRAVAGYALMGGGSDLDEAFDFLCKKAASGDFLIVRAAGGDDYNSYVNQLCHVNSVATLIIPSRDAANDARVAEIILKAEAVFIAGGDQARYINWWQGTLVQNALNEHIRAGKPIGGTSAGLAVLGDFIYSAQGDAPDDGSLTSAQALANPCAPRVTVRRDFLKLRLLHNTLTDTHFAKRDRMGRTLVFLARIVQDRWSADPRAIAVDEKSALLVEADGKARVIGPGFGAYFIRVTEKPSVCREETPLSFHGFVVYRAPQGSTFDLEAWKGAGGHTYQLSAEAGSISSSQEGGATY